MNGPFLFHLASLNRPKKSVIERRLNLFLQTMHSLFLENLETLVAYFAVINLYWQQGHEAKNKEPSHSSIKETSLCLYLALTRLSSSFILSISSSLFHQHVCLVGFCPGIFRRFISSTFSFQRGDCSCSGFYIFSPPSLALCPSFKQFCLHGPLVPLNESRKRRRRLNCNLIYSLMRLVCFRGESDINGSPRSHLKSLNFLKIIQVLTVQAALTCFEEVRLSSQ